MKAIWNNTVIAESNETVKLEGNYYFPPGSVMTHFLRNSSTHTTCSWKGKASYYDIVDGRCDQSGCGMVLSRTETGGVKH